MHNLLRAILDGDFDIPPLIDREKNVLQLIACIRVLCDKTHQDYELKHSGSSIGHNR